MMKQHPHANATYRIVARDDQSYDVEVAIPDQQPAMISGLGTLEDAEAWIGRHKQRVLAASESSRSRWKR
jgi:hypothetical protein